MAQQTNTENATIMLAGKGLTPEQQRYLLQVRAKHWNQPISLWKPITFGKK